MAPRFSFSATPWSRASPHQRVAVRLPSPGWSSGAFTQEEKVRSNRPVQLTRGNDRFTADTMEYDNLDQVLQLNGRVRGVLMPTPAK